jgi:hypothetical protein
MRVHQPAVLGLEPSLRGERREALREAHTRILRARGAGPASVDRRALLVGRSSLSGVTNPDGAKPGAGTIPTLPGFGMVPGGGDLMPGGTGRVPGGGISPGFGIAEALVDATAEGSADAVALTVGSGAARLPTASIDTVPTGIDVDEDFAVALSGVAVGSLQADAAPAATSVATESPIAGLTMDRRTAAALFALMRTILLLLLVHREAHVRITGERG